MHRLNAELSLSGPAALGRRRLLKAAAAALAAAPFLGLRAQAPSPRWVDFEWLDARRQRPVPARLYLPPHARGPLVVFSHGVGGSRLGYSHIGQHLASGGVASLHLQHVGSDRSLWGGNVFQLADRLRRAISNEEATARAQDVRFGLDRLAEQALPFEPELVVAAGHSYGANTSLLVAGARVASVQPLVDERVRALVLLSAPPFYGMPDLAATVGAIGLPSLHITTAEDVIKIPGYESPASDRVAVFQAMGSRPKALAVFAQGSHSIFTDRQTTADGPELNAAVKLGTRELVLAFVRGLADGRPSQQLEAAAEPHRARLSRFIVEA